MDIQLITPFLSAVRSVLEQFGIGDFQKGPIAKKENMTVDKDITSVVGIVGDIRGNISYSLNNDTAKQIASTMMMGMAVEQMDEMARSAIGELSNMITGTASASLGEMGKTVDITPPTVLFGQDILFIISTVETLSIIMKCAAGDIEVNIGLE